MMVDNPLYTGKHGLDVPHDNYASEVSLSESGVQSNDPICNKRYSPQTDNVTATVNITPDGATTKQLPVQMQMEGGMWD